VTSHTVTLTGLTASTTYNYAVTSANSAGASATSANFTFMTSSPVAGPTISGVAYWGISGSGIVISWSTSQPADTAVEYGTTPAFGQTSAVDPAMTISHGVTLSGLNGGTTYYFRTRSVNAAGGVGYSATFSFTTLDTAGPVISNVVATPGPNNTATVSWTASKPAWTQIEYGTNQNYGWWTPITTASSTALGWVPSGTIHFRIHSTDSFGNRTTTGNYTFVEP
jgi:hypothetical protein